MLATENGCAYQIVQSGKVSQERIRSVEQRTTWARGLAFVHRVQVQLANDQQISSLLRDIVNRDMPPEKWEAWQRIFIHLGAVPKDFKLYDQILYLLIDQAAGFYDPLTKKLYLATKPVPAGPILPMVEFLLQRDLVREFLISHELIHALQDQHFDLGKCLLEKQDRFDESLAAHAVIEGDAVLGSLIALTGNLAMVEAQGDLGSKIQQESAKSGTEALKKTPPILQEYLIFPYYAGLKFVQAYVRKHNWKTIDKVYARLPVSTEQVIHPEKYFADERPLAIDLEKAKGRLGPDWQILEENTLGEALMAVLFSPQAAAGWGGDKFFLARNKANAGQEIMLWETLWDTEADAVEFEQALQAWQRKRGKLEEVERIERDGARVRWIQAPNENLARSFTETGPS